MSATLAASATHCSATLATMGPRAAGTMRRRRMLNTFDFLSVMAAAKARPVPNRKRRRQARLRSRSRKGESAEAPREGGLSPQAPPGALATDRRRGAIHMNVKKDT